MLSSARVLERRPQGPARHDPPALPARWSAEALLISCSCSLSMPVTRSKRGERQRPLSTTTVTPSIVKLDSAIGVARTTRLSPPGDGLRSQSDEAALGDFDALDDELATNCLINNSRINRPDRFVLGLGRQISVEREDNGGWTSHFAQQIFHLANLADALIRFCFLFFFPAAAIVIFRLSDSAEVDGRVAGGRRACGRRNSPGRNTRTSPRSSSSALTTARATAFSSSPRPDAGDPTNLRARIISSQGQRSQANRSERVSI